MIIDSSDRQAFEDDMEAEGEILKEEAMAKHINVIYVPSEDAIVVYTPYRPF